MKILFWMVMIGLVPVMMAGCAWRDPDITSSSTCKGTDPVTKNCNAWEETFKCEVRMPLFFYDYTAAICKEEKDCRDVCDKIGKGT